MLKSPYIYQGHRKLPQVLFDLPCIKKGTCILTAPDSPSVSCNGNSLEMDPVETGVGEVNQDGGSGSSR